MLPDCFHTHKKWLICRVFGVTTCGVSKRSLRWLTTESAPATLQRPGAGSPTQPKEVELHEQD